MFKSSSSSGSGSEQERLQELERTSQNTQNDLTEIKRMLQMLGQQQGQGQGLQGQQQGTTLQALPVQSSGAVIFQPAIAAVPAITTQPQQQQQPQQPQIQYVQPKECPTQMSPFSRYDLTKLGVNNALADISVIPLGTKHTGITPQIVEVQKVFLESHVEAKLHAFGNNVEARNWEDLALVVQKIHYKLHSQGVPRIITHINFETRTDPTHLGEKVSHVLSALESGGAYGSGQGQYGSSAQQGLSGSTGSTSGTTQSGTVGSSSSSVGNM
jgi:uncharacterized protein (TIGR00106 family)